MALITTVFSTKGGRGKTLTTTTSDDNHISLDCQGGLKHEQAPEE